MEIELMTLQQINSSYQIIVCDNMDCFLYRLNIFYIICIWIITFPNASSTSVQIPKASVVMVKSEDEDGAEMIKCCTVMCFFVSTFSELWMCPGWRALTYGETVLAFILDNLTLGGGMIYDIQYDLVPDQEVRSIGSSHIVLFYKNSQITEQSHWSVISKYSLIVKWPLTFTLSFLKLDFILIMYFISPMNSETLLYVCSVS